MIRKHYGRGTSRDIAAPPLRAPATTHCQICERDIYANNIRGVIAHHGYKRPGFGEQTSSCFGARWQPYEESRSAIEPYMVVVRGALTMCEDHIARMKVPGYSWKEHFQKKHPAHALDFEIKEFKPQPDNEKEHYAYLSALSHRLSGEEHRVVLLNQELTRLQLRYNNWNPKESQ